MALETANTKSGGFPHATRKNLNIIIVSFVFSGQHFNLSDDLQVGASLGGLATALAIKRLPAPHAHNITLLERNPTALLHNQGVGIVAGGDTLAFFKRYDKCGRDLAAGSIRRQYLNKDGEIVHKEDMRQNMTSWDLVYHMLRANVDGVKSAYCEVPKDDENNDRVKHLHGHKVIGLEEKDDKIVIQYETADEEKGSMEAWKQILSLVRMGQVQ
jgi:2-polyprenyl-6-methoxyphenol hydroxylase-like FAD-dependent oxidoreductase